MPKNWLPKTVISQISQLKENHTSWLINNDCEGVLEDTDRVAAIIGCPPLDAEWRLRSYGYFRKLSDLGRCKQMVDCGEYEQEVLHNSLRSLSDPLHCDINELEQYRHDADTAWGE